MTMPTPASVLGALGVVLSLLKITLAKQDRICATDPFADPRDDPCNALRYIASNTLSGIAFGLYVAVGICHVLSTLRWGARWMSAMTIGIFTFATGIGCRFGLHSNPDSTGIYIAEYLFVVLSPCAFIAADYVLLGRLSRDLGKGQYLWISPNKITRIFVLSDVTTFLIQAIGGSISIAANDLKVNKIGSNVFLAGLAAQLASFLTFTVMYLRFLWLVRRNDPQIWQRDSSSGLSWFHDWRTLAGALLVSCGGIIIRSLFRVIELSQGFEGAIATNEALFYGLDTLPLFIAVSIYVPFWPGRFFRLKVQQIDSGTLESSEKRPVS